MEEILKEFEKRANYFIKAEKLFEELGLDVEIDKNKFGGNKKHALISLKPIRIQQNKRLVAKLRKMKNIKEEYDAEGGNINVYFILMMPWEKNMMSTN